MAQTRALVLGGGGVAGIAWETGVIAGLADAGVDVTGADLLLGTSAGANVAAQVGSGLPLEELFRRQTEPALQSRELMPPGNPLFDLGTLWGEIVAEAAGDQVKVGRRLGELAGTAHTVPVIARYAVIETRLPVHDWPDRTVRVVAVDADTGEPRIFDRTSGVSLIHAVAASSAVPLIWPVVPIAGARYIDGGVRSSSNADFAAGHDRVLILLPSPDPRVDEEIAALTAAGSRVEVIAPDAATFAALGDNPLDPATRTPAAEAGRAQGRMEAARIDRLWN